MKAEFNIEEYDAELDETELKLLSSFCNYFTDDSKSKGNGYKFEYFLRYYLDLLGFEDIAVTRGSKDGGVDLTASCSLSLNQAANVIPDSREEYYIQAKFKNLKDGAPSYLPPHEIQALRGSIENGRGLLITTGRIYQGNFEKALYRSPNTRRNIPVQIIDAGRLIHSFKELHVPFIEWDDSALPINQKILDSIIDKNRNDMGALRPIKIDDDTESFEQTVLAVNITQNNVRAKTLPIPSEFIPGNGETGNNVFVETRFPQIPEDDEFQQRKVNVPRKYISQSISGIYRKLKLLDASNNVDEEEFSKYRSLKAYWCREKESNRYTIQIRLE